jgi:hypothetical protein
MARLELMPNKLHAQQVLFHILGFRAAAPLLHECNETAERAAFSGELFCPDEAALVQ